MRNNPIRQKLNDHFWNGFFAILCPVAHACSLLDFKTPDYIYDIQNIADPDKLNHEFEKSLRNALGTADHNSQTGLPIVFVFGEWGAGKTFQLLCYKNKVDAPNMEVEYFSFWGVHTVQEGLLLTIPVTQRLWIGAMLVPLFFCLYLFGANTATASFAWTLSSLLFTLLCAILLIPSRWKLLATIVAMLGSNLGLNNHKRIVIIDDLERSSLTADEQWRLLLSLWRCNVQYIIPIGYGHSRSRQDWREMVAKLHGQIVDLPTSKEDKFKLWNEERLGFFNAPGDWIDYLTPRDILAIRDRWYDFSDDWPEFEMATELLLLKLTLDRVLDKIGITVDRRTSFTPSLDRGLRFEAKAPAFEISERNHINRALSSLYKTLPIGTFKAMDECLQETGLSTAFLTIRPEELLRRLPPTHPQALSK